jgi:hypothetical protein
MFCDSRVALTNTVQLNHVPDCAAVCVVLIAKESEECISAPDVRWECAWCLVLRNSTLKWICKSPQLWIPCVVIKQWSKVSQTFAATTIMWVMNYLHRKPLTGRPAGRPKSRWVDDIRNDMRRCKLLSGQNRSKITPNGSSSLRRPKLSQSCSA